MNAPMANASDLDAHDVDAGAGGGALVGPHREHLRSRAGSRAQPRHADGDDHQHDEHEEAERRGGDSRCRPASGGRARTASVRSMSLPLTPDEVGVVEPQRLERDRHRQRHDRDGQTPDAERREPDDHADDGGAERREERRDRERDRPSWSSSVPEQEPGHAGEGELGERDLSGVAGHHDEGEGDDGEDEAGDEGDAPVAVQDDQARPAPATVPRTAGTRDRARSRRPSERLLRMSAPRLGSGRARTTRTTRIRISGTSSGTPDAGSQSCWPWR